MNQKIRLELEAYIKENENNININNSIDYTKKIIETALCDKTIAKYLKILKDASIHTYYHSLNVAVISTVMGLGMKLKPSDIIDLVESALLHDIGKSKVDAKVLNKPDKLNDEEYKHIQMHSLYGYSMISEEKDISKAAKQGVLFHHENFNGTGYPLGFKEDEIPLISKIIHIADIYDAMRKERPYKQSYSTHECFEYMMSLSGTIVDPKILKFFLLYYPAYEVGKNVSLSTGDEAVVLKNYKKEYLRPKVKTIDGKVIYLNRMKNLNITITD